MTNYGDRVRERRIAEGLKQREVADEMGIAACTLSQYERGTRPISQARVFEAFAAIERLKERRGRAQRETEAQALDVARSEVSS